MSSLEILASAALMGVVVHEIVIDNPQFRNFLLGCFDLSLLHDRSKMAPEKRENIVGRKIYIVDAKTRHRIPAIIVSEKDHSVIVVRKIAV